jgi:hypothetical protein
MNVNVAKDSGRTTPKHSSREVMPNSGNRNNNQNGSGGFFMTQPDRDLVSSTMPSPAAPRTGASAFRKSHMAPLLSHGHQRMVSMNNSQAQVFSPMSGISEIVSPLDIQREKEKIARFLHTKERSGMVLADRERRIEERLKKMETKQNEYEKRKRIERKHDLAKLNERKEDVYERQTKVRIHN